jgi:hypothetical protein
MGVFTNNIKNDLPTKVRVEQEIYMAIHAIEDRVNNDLGSCRFVEPNLGTLSILLNEIHYDICENKIKIDKGIGIALRDTKLAKVQPRDPEKIGYTLNFSIVCNDKQTDEKLMFNTDLDVYVYLYPHWEPKRFSK